MALPMDIPERLDEDGTMEPVEVEVEIDSGRRRHGEGGWGRKNGSYL
jgi:hypothetical protein